MPRTPETKHGLLSQHALALCITAVAVAAAALPLLLVPAPPLPATPGHIMTYSTIDTSVQMRAHKILLCVLALLALAGPWLRALLGRALGSAGCAAANRLAARVGQAPAWLTLVLLPLALWAYRGVGRDQYLLGLALFGAVFLLGGRLAANRPARLACGAALGLYAALLLLPGFYGSFTFGAELETGLMHYFGLFGLAPLLATGRDLFANKQVFYGLLPQTILAVQQRACGLLPLGGYVLLVQVSQVVFAALALLAYRLLAPGRPLRALFCLGLWLPWISTAGGSILGPTASGLRFMSYPVAVLVLLLAPRLSRQGQGLALGLTAGLALLHNLETGLCIALAFAAYSIVAERAGDFRALFRRLLWMLLAGLASLALYLLLFRLGLGRWPAASLDNLFHFIRLFSSGFGGLPLVFDPLALLVLLYPAYLLARLTGVWLRAGLSERMRFKFAVSFLILLWLAYYFNRVHQLNLWSHTFLFTCLIIDLPPRPQSLWSGGKGLASLWRARVPALALVLVFILGPAFVNTGLSEAKTVWRSTARRLALAADPAGQERLSGLWLDARRAQAIRARSAQVLELAATHKRLVFIGPDQFLLQLETGMFFPLPVQDLLAESLSGPGFDRNVAALLRYAPEVILLADGGDFPDVFRERRAFSAHLGTLLSARYAPAGETGGWQVLARTGRPPAGADGCCRAGPQPY